MVVKGVDGKNGRYGIHIFTRILKRWRSETIKNRAYPKS
jgi:hypothetical protein